MKDKLPKLTQHEYPPAQRLFLLFFAGILSLGAILLYLGIAIWLGSLSALGIVLLPAICLLLYIKLLEEKEMEQRFGTDYIEYRRRTPFLFPRFRSSPVQHREPNHEA